MIFVLWWIYDVNNVSPSLKISVHYRDQKWRIFAFCGTLPSVISVEQRVSGLMLDLNVLQMPANNEVRFTITIKFILWQCNPQEMSCTNQCLHMITGLIGVTRIVFLVTHLSTIWRDLQRNQLLIIQILWSSLRK